MVSQHVICKKQKNEKKNPKPNKTKHNLRMHIAIKTCQNEKQEKVKSRLKTVLFLGGGQKGLEVFKREKNIGKDINHIESSGKLLSENN